MKNGYKHKTVVYGTDAEWYAASLFQMIRNPNGQRRPDLISFPDQYTVRLAMEVKSGRARKGVLVKYQLHYSITGAQDFREMFGESLPLPTEDPALFDITRPEINNYPVAFYYNVIDRIDGKASDELDRPFTAIQLKFGDNHIVPGEYGFYAFAVARHIRTGEKMNNILDELRESIRKNILNNHSNYIQNKDRQSWQDLSGRDILAVFHNDPAYTTKHGQARIRVLQTHYTNLKNLKPLKMKGPNGSWVYVLAEPTHEKLFDKEVRATVCTRRPILEKITRARVNANSLLNKIHVIKGQTELFGNGEANNMVSLKRLKNHEVQRLERLVHWLDRGEHVLTEKDYIPF